MLIGAGGNIVVQAGDEGVLVIDTGTAARGADVLAAIRKISDKPIRIVDQHARARGSYRCQRDHRRNGQGARAATRQAIRAFPRERACPGARERPQAHERAVGRAVAQSRLLRGRLRPSSAKTRRSSSTTKRFSCFYQPGHTDGDIVVFFRKSDVVVSGDLFLTTTYPVIDAQSGGSVQGIIDGLNRILDLTIPKDKQEGGTYVVPGHGRLSDEADVVEYRDMLTIVRDRIQDLVANGKTLAEVKAARSTLDYDGRYGCDHGSVDDGHVHRSGLSRADEKIGRSSVHGPRSPSRCLLPTAYGLLLT